jgi:hypothetical protein
MMDKKITIELDWDTIDRVTICSMKSLVECLEADLKKRKDKTGMAIFVKDKKKDIAEIQRHIDAFQTVLNYYGEGLVTRPTMREDVNNEEV